MKNSILVILLGFLSIVFVRASNNPEIIETNNGDSIEVSVVSDGKLTLYAHETEILPATIPQDPAKPYTRIHTTYLVTGGSDDLTEINCGNYKKILRARLSDDPELTAKIGEKGFRYSDLEAIVKTYNGEL